VFKHRTSPNGFGQIRSETKRWFQHTIILSSPLVNIEYHLQGCMSGRFAVCFVTDKECLLKIPSISTKVGGCRI